MGYLTRVAGFPNTDGLTLSTWFYVFPQPVTGTSTTHRTLFRCGEDIGAVDASPFSGTTIGCYVSDFGDQVYIDLRNFSGFAGQAANTAPLTGGGSVNRGAWNHVVVNFQVPGDLTLTAQMCLNGIVRSARIISSSVPTIPLNAGYVGVPTDSVFAQSINYSPSLPMADYQMWFYKNIALTDANMTRFFTITDGRGYPTNPIEASNAFGVQSILFKGKASDASFYFNRGTAGAFSKIATVSDFTPTPSF